MSESFIYRGVILEKDFSILANHGANDSKLTYAMRGILWNLLTKPPGWRISTKHLATLYDGPMKKGNGPDAIDTIMKGLRQNGYILYKKTRNSRGHWEHIYIVLPLPKDLFKERYPYHYEEIQKIIPEEDYPAVVYPAVDNPPITERTKREKIENIKKEQQQAAAVFFECLKGIDIPESEKIDISKKYPEADVIHAVKWATHPETKINKSLSAAIRWAITAKPTITLSKAALIEENKSWTFQIVSKAKCPKGIRIEPLNHFLEVGNGVHQPTCVQYDQSGFKEKALEAFKRWGIVMME